MPVITGTIHQGQIVPDAPLELPEGTKVDITPRQSLDTMIGLDPSELRDDAAALADSAGWINTFEPIEFTPDEADVPYTVIDKRDRPMTTILPHVHDHESAVSFILGCIARLGLCYHPDTPFAEYINGDEQKIFDPLEAAMLDELTQRTFLYCDPYEIGWAEFRRILGINESDP